MKLFTKTLHGRSETLVQAGKIGRIDGFHLDKNPLAPGDRNEADELVIAQGMALIKITVIERLRFSRELSAAIVRSPPFHWCETGSNRVLC
jgi:hypothetical protein